VNYFRAINLLIAATAAASAGAQDILDRVEDSLSFSLFHNEARVRLSGLLDVEQYHFDQPPPGLIDASGHNLFNPRLTLFLDAQLGQHVYVFAQGRVDRGFDPKDGPAQARADEYALRYTPWNDARLNLQVGKFATIVGGYSARHLSWDNPFVTAPMPYEHVSGLSDTEPPTSRKDLIGRAVTADYEENPIIWGPVYATGASASSRLGKFEFAAEIKNAALSSRPESWDPIDVGFEHPSVAARVAYHPNEMWNFAVSASEGAYFREEARPLLPPGRGIGDYHQQTLAQEASFAWHHWQLWVEAFENRFQIPNVGDADQFGYYFEAKYKITPRLFGAARWNQEMFGDISDGAGGRAPWGRNGWRTDFALGYRPNAHTQVKLQYSLAREWPAIRTFDHLLAAQFTIRF
jgi:hypothetical protein